MTRPGVVFHVDSDPDRRRAVESLLRTAEIPCQSFASGQDFLTFCPTDHPGCLLIEAGDGGTAGLALLRASAQRSILMPAIFLNGHVDLAVVAEAMTVGGVTFLAQPIEEATFLARIRAALERDSQQRTERSRHEQTARRLGTLNSGERDVLALMTQGKGYKTIAAHLAVSYKTVEARRAKIMNKMQCETLAELLSTVITYHMWCDMQVGLEAERVREWLRLSPPPERTTRR